MKKANRGFTFIELMFTSFIIIIAVLALLKVYAGSLNLVMRAREIDIATDDLKDVLEAINSTAFSNLPMDFPAGNLNNPAGKIGALLLNNEQIQLTYYDFSSGISVTINPQNIPDPLLIKVSVSWTGRDRRNYNQAFTTIRTRGI